jgi:hypothetical protein
MLEHGDAREAPSRRAFTVGHWLIVASVGVTLLGIACFVVPAWMRGNSQRARVAPLLRFHASIEAQYAHYQYQPPPTVPVDGTTIMLVLGRGQRVSGFSVQDEPAGWLAWVAPLFDEHCFAPVTSITILDEEFSDADVDLLLAFPEVREIDVSYTSIGDAGLVKLATLDELALLDVSGTRITSASLRSLSDCRQLRELDISDTGADEESVRSLQAALPDCWIRSD